MLFVGSIGLLGSMLIGTALQLILKSWIVREIVASRSCQRYSYLCKMFYFKDRSISAEILL